MKWIDMPPVWLLGALVLAWLQSQHLSLGLGFPGPIPDLLGGLLVGGGVVLIALAAYEFRQKRTTIVPHELPTTLITSGIFKRSRNPIYLADVLILAGLILQWDAVLALPLIPILFWVLEKRFVLKEERRMRLRFGREFAAYERKTRRWM